MKKKEYCVPSKAWTVRFVSVTRRLSVDQYALISTTTLVLFFSDSFKKFRDRIYFGLRSFIFLAREELILRFFFFINFLLVVFAMNIDVQ